ncbi:unnamed protein product [Owenia fusiformis]|uniref:Uncharacterized protein n=1 Tax=Owenia fusiformis TaxID=6347 RepID=A0A8J1XR10_OWEFU|nr:unnamed protein product [Owenia fusiformis]
MSVGLPGSVALHKTGGSSAYHESCIPAAKKNVSVPPPRQNYTEADYTKCDIVTQDEVWKQSVNKEKKGVKEWEENWGFMTEFDPKGRPKSAKEEPTNKSQFSEDINVPNTNSGNYGNRLNTEVGQTMQNMEFQFNSGSRKKKMGSDMICY